MDEIKKNIAKNIVELRLNRGLTQIELAEKLNYSDKAISKWERAESMPNISVLVQIADLFEVPIDYLVRAKQAEIVKKIKTNDNRTKRNHAIITSMSILLVWLIATFVFVIIDIISTQSTIHWISFVYAVNISMIVWLVFNSIWFEHKRNYLIISLLMWTTLISIYISLMQFGFNVCLIFFLGIPGQIIILMWSKLRYTKNK